MTTNELLCLAFAVGFAVFVLCGLCELYLERKERKRKPV